ncbi:MAG TPA: phospholipid carrier-dependent glycosyltransferase [Blastocatellia bacterium]|nr:phospholipid carrier-dependent glycosyltransferase [Blastocatellia bacterium]
MARTRKAKTSPAARREVAADPRAKAGSVKAARRVRAIQSRESRRKERLILGAVLVITFLAFANSLNGEFVYDDRLQVLNNPTIKSLSNIPRMLTESVWQFMNQGAAGPVGPYYRPLFNVALIINYHLFEFSVTGWHLVSVLFHLGVVLLVYMLAHRYGLTSQAAAIAAAVFGLHPVHSESVAWVSGIPDPMAAVFILTSMLVYERYRETPARWPRFAVSAGLALLALLSKETAIALPVFLAVREALDRPEGESLTALGRRMVSRAAPFFGVAGLYVVLRYLVLGFLRQDEPGSAGIPFAHVLLTIPSVLVS